MDVIKVPFFDPMQDQKDKLLQKLGSELEYGKRRFFQVAYPPAYRNSLEWLKISLQSK